MEDSKLGYSFNFGGANETQRKAIQTTEGPVLIIAGPGTGKTFTLVKRAIYLMVEKKVAPEDIMIATFTEKAAKELLTRLSNELLEQDILVNVNELYIGTIHSICLRFIKEHLEYSHLKKDYRIIDDFEQKYMVYQNINMFKNIANVDLVFGETKSSWEQARVICYYANAISEELVDLNNLSKSEEPSIKALADILIQYKNLLNNENALDFSSIQSEAFRMLKENPNVCESLQNKLKYIMIDEYQDTNYVQEQLIMLLGQNNNNICVVGDDDQGLYRFRGATIRNILEFPSKFNHCEQFILNENYRSEKDIINFYNKWMQTTNGDKFDFTWDNYRFNKNILPAKNHFIENQPTVLKIPGNGDEISWQQNILDFLNTVKSSGKLQDLNQIAFLFKSVKNKNVISLGNFLERNGIPVYSPRSDLFFERKEIKLLIGFIMSMFPQYVKQFDSGKFFLNEKLEHYYRNCLDLIVDFIKNNDDKALITWIKHRAVEHFSLSENEDYAFSGLMYQLFQFQTFRNILNTDISSGVNDTRAIRNIAKFSNIVTKFEFIHKIKVFTVKSIDFYIEKFFNTYLRFLIDGGIGEYEDESDYAPKGCVSFMTIHQSKGLEFPIVIVGSLYDIPRDDKNNIIKTLEKKYYHRKPFEPYECIKYYDFWRLYYTAFSRAQNLLCLTAKYSRGHRSDPSRFFAESFNSIPYYWDSSIDYTKYIFESIKDVNIKPSYSFTSSISVYEICPMQYKFYKELGFSAVRKGQSIFGTLVHATIEDIHRAVLRGEKEIVTNENIEKWFNMIYDSICLKEHEYLTDNVKDAALRHIKNYAKNNASTWDKIKEAEVEISHIEPDYILKGRVDLIKGDGNSIEIIDFKSEKKPDIINDVERIERYHRQLDIYAYIIEHKMDVKVSKLHLYYTGTENSSPWISFDYNVNEIQTAIDGINDVVKKINNKNFSCRSNNEKVCRECDFRFYCDKE